MKWKFKAGDIVQVVLGGRGIANQHINKLVTIRDRVVREGNDIESCPGYTIEEGHLVMTYLYKGIDERSFKLAQRPRELELITNGGNPYL